MLYSQVSSQPLAEPGAPGLYDQTHQDYVYTEAWVEKLARELADEAQYNLVVRRLAAPVGAAAAGAA